MSDLAERVRALLGRLHELKPAFGIDILRAKLGELRKASEASGLWDDPARGQQIMSELAETEREVKRFTEIEDGLNEVQELLEASASEGDQSLRSELEAKLDELSKTLDELEHELLFGGPYDRSDAYISIYAGTGGTDAQDFAEMLLRMYLRFAEKQGLTADLQSSSPGEEAGIKSATIKVSGRLTYGLLRGEHGVHRLVRLSPFNAQNLRQTSFVLVDIIPVLETAQGIELKDSDLRIDVFRSSGAGGQSVNTTDSAVRITHLPTGLVATCQNERSQLQNREKALEILRSKLALLEAQRRQGETAELRGETPSADWGSQIRSYVLHPYQMVKDHRTGAETSDTSGVLDGDLQLFIDAYLAWTASKKGIKNKK